MMLLEASARRQMKRRRNVFCQAMQRGRHIEALQKMN